MKLTINGLQHKGLFGDGARRFDVTFYVEILRISNGDIAASDSMKKSVRPENGDKLSFAWESQREVEALDCPGPHSNFRMRIYVQGHGPNSTLVIPPRDPKDDGQVEEPVPAPGQDKESSTFNVRWNDETHPDWKHRGHQYAIDFKVDP